jgi:integrase
MINKEIGTMARTGENISKRKDGRWEARYIREYDGDGKARYHSLYAKTYAEARQKLRLAVSGQLTAKAGQSGTALFSEWTEGWLQNTRLRVKASTYARYRELTEKHILPQLGKFPADKMSTELIEGYVSRLLNDGRLDGGGGLSPKTAEDILTVIKGVFKYAKCCGRIDFERIKLKKNPKEMRVLTELEQAKLNNVLFRNTDLQKLGVLLSLYTGIRVGEVCALRWENISLPEQTLRVKSTMQRMRNFQSEAGGKTSVCVTEPKSKCSVRAIPLPAFLMPVLTEMAAFPKAFVLTGESGCFVEPRVMQNRFKDYLQQAGIADANYHSTRHTFSTRCVESGFEIKSLSEILGHANVKITLERYVHSSFALKRANMDRLVPAFA